MNEEHGYREEIRTNLPRPVEISWGAILAGLFAMLGVSWLLYLLGLSIGVSVADLSDDTLLDDGLPQAVALWMVLSAGVAYFVGAALTSRLAGVADETVGMLHGLTLWGVATVATLMLGYCGVTTLLQTGQGFASGAASAAAASVDTGARAVSGGAATALDGARSMADTELASAVRRQLKNRVAEAVASIDTGESDVSEEDVRQAIENLDQETFDELTADLADGDQESAAALISDNTSLNEAQAEALIDGAYRELEERFGDPDNDESLAGDLRNTLIDQTAEAVAAFDADGGSEVSAQEIRRALRSLDSEAFKEITNAALASDWSRVNDLIVEETDLSTKQTREIVRGVKKAYQSRISAVAETADEAIETVSTYANQVLWAAFATTALGLAISVLGGWCGVDANKRLYYEVREKPVTE